MADVTIYNSRIYGPDDGKNERPIMHPETNSDQIYMPDNSLLTDAIGMDVQMESSVKLTEGAEKGKEYRDVLLFRMESTGTVNPV